MKKTNIYVNEEGFSTCPAIWCCLCLCNLACKFLMLYSFYRTPSVTISTNSYHFCKLSLVKNPVNEVKPAETSVQEQHVDCGGDVDSTVKTAKTVEYQPENLGELSNLSFCHLRSSKFSLSSASKLSSFLSVYCRCRSQGFCLWTLLFLWHVISDANIIHWMTKWSLLFEAGVPFGFTAMVLLYE